ncbi:MAG: hypothetical protein HYT98_04560 [Candidatus Sungbacteria bacterium]|nr:hypothetical protein [Candidatus Sungbacteria bacterium]
MKKRSTYWLEDNERRLNLLREHRLDPWEELEKLFPEKTRRAIKHTMSGYRIRRDRDKVPDANVGPQKWTQELIEDLRENRNKPWPFLTKRFGCRKRQLESIMGENDIRRDRLENIIWDENHERILIEAALESHSYSPYISAGRKKLRDIIIATRAKLKELGFRGSTTHNALKMHIHNLTPERVAALGFKEILIPIIWGKSEKGKVEEVTVRWWEELEKSDSERYQKFKDEFLNRWRSDYRVAGNTNEDLLKEWQEAVSVDGLKAAARFLGETRTRIEIVREYKSVEELDKKIDRRMTELIYENILKEAGAEGLRQRILIEFADEIAKIKFNLTPEYFGKKLGRILWVDEKGGALATLREFIEKGIVDKFTEYHRHIPLEMIQSKEREERGLTTVKHPAPFASNFVHGIGRIIGDGDKDIPEEEIRNFKLPEISFDKPLEIAFRDPRNFKFGIMSGPQLGLLHTPRMEQNPIRRSFAYAERNKWEAFLLTGIFDLDMTKAAGPVKGLRSLYSGRNTNVNVLDPGYQEVALGVINAIKANEFTSEIIYETAKEAAKNLLCGWWNVFIRPDKTPEFSGKVLIVFGPKEFETVMAAAHAEIVFITGRKQGELRALAAAAARAMRRDEKEIRAIDKKLADLERDLTREEDPAVKEKLQKTYEDLRNTLTEDKKEIEELKAEFRRLKEQESRTRMTNVTPEDWQRFHKLALALISLLVQRAIPGSQVISLGDTFIKVGPEPKDKVHIVIPGHLQVTDALLSKFCDSYASLALSMKMAETVVICHPHAISYAVTAREVDAKGKREYSPRVYVAPILVDGKFMREKTSQIVRGGGHPIRSVVNHPMFQGGLLEITATNGMVNASPVTIEALGFYETIARRKSPTKYPTGKYIWIMAATDQHWGGRAKEFLRNPRVGKSLGMAEAVFYLMHMSGYGDGDKLPPFHMFVVNDDPTQGHHFPAEKEPHRHEMQHYRFEKELHELRGQIKAEKNPRIRETLIDKMEAFSSRQVRVRGTDSYTRQIDAFVKCHIKPNIDIFSGMLLRSIKAGLRLRPVSEFEDYLEVPYDTCDLGFDNNGTGNHGIKTTDGNLSEGWLFAEFKKSYLLARPQWAGQEELLDKYVKGPVFGNKFIAFGTVQASGGYEYAFDLRNTPAANAVDWGNTVRQGARIALRRANYSRIFDEKFIVRMSGDKHFLGALLASFFLEFMAPAGTHTDAFGELGFPPNNTGIVFLGLPAEGPRSGPILIRPLLVHHLRDYIEEHPRSFDWEAFLPNPL